MYIYIYIHIYIYIYIYKHYKHTSMYSLAMMATARNYKHGLSASRYILSL